MTDERAPRAAAHNHDLRAVTVRLADLQRKCRSAGSRNDEAGEIEQRLASVLARLSPEDDEPVPFATLARELYAVERFFESNGFISVAKEVAHVERKLEEMASPDEQQAAAAPSTTDASPSGADEQPTDDEHTAEEDAVSRWAIPRPVAVILVIFVVAVFVCAAIIYRRLNPQAETSAAAAPSAPAAAAAAAAPTPTPAPAVEREPEPDRQEPEMSPGAILAQEVGRARLALVEGDVDAVIDHLSRASLVDPDHHTVLGTANQLVVLLVDRADEAADGGLWEIADLTLARATRIASRYHLDTQPIDDAARRHARMDRFRVVRPDDATAIRAAAGSRVTIVFTDGDTRDSILNGVEGGELLLNEDNEVRGGAMYYVERIPLNDIDYIKVWES